MYYETVSHQVVPVADATEAATKIKTGGVHTFQTLCWQTSHGKFYAVSDVHIDSSPFFETAILQEVNSEFFQIESITSGWIDSKEKLAEYFRTAETEPAIKSKTHLIVGKPTTQRADFTCGCCGSWFNGIVAEQLAYDQDDGYGICDDCSKRYS